MRPYDIILSIYQIRRKADDWSPYHNVMTYGISAGVSLMMGTYGFSGWNVIEQIDEPGWEEPREMNQHKLVRVEIPDTIHFGEHSYGNTILNGPYGEYTARDGMKKSVLIYCEHPAVGIIHEEEAVMEATIAGGICASVPTKSGTREEIRFNVVSVSEMYRETIPANWDLIMENIQFHPIKRMRINRGMTIAQLAEASGVNARQIIRVEQGESDSGNLTAKNLLAIADALQVDPRKLIERGSEGMF